MKTNKVADNRVTSEVRRLIDPWRQAGIGNNAIVRRLNWDRRVISREIKLNLGQCGDRPKPARAKCPGHRRITEVVRRVAEAKLRQGWTLETLCERMRRQGCAQVCKVTFTRDMQNVFQSRAFDLLVADASFWPEPVPDLLLLHSESPI